MYRKAHSESVVASMDEQVEAGMKEYVESKAAPLLDEITQNIFRLMIFKRLTQILTGCGLTVVYDGDGDLLALSVCYCKLSGNQKTTNSAHLLPLCSLTFSLSSAIRILTFVAFNLFGHFSLLISM